MQAVESTNSAYEVKNLLLTQPSDWFIDNDTFRAVKESQFDIVRFLKSEGQKNLDALSLHKILQEPVKTFIRHLYFQKHFAIYLKTN